MKDLRLPQFLRDKIKNKQSIDVVELQKKLKDLHLNTVCQSARCPNLGECFGNNTATFMILGNVCTRNCRFCNINHGNPEIVEDTEPENIAKMVELLNLQHTVITSVTRDDLEDGGVEQFIKTVRAIKNRTSTVTIEVLTPDFKGDLNQIKMILNEKIDVFNHNIETIERLYQEARPQADYNQSLKILKFAAEKRDRKFLVKSGFMIGLGETKDEIAELMGDLKKTGVEVVTIGQYLKPSLEHIEVKKYYQDDEFKYFEELGNEMGFLSTVSGAFVRSSYSAGKILNQIKS